MITPPESLVQLLKPWADFYSHSKVAETVVEFLHIGGLLLAGGLAIAADRSTMRALLLPVSERPLHMMELASVHRWVLTGLTVIVVSGLALLTADIETFFGSWIFWTKMGLVILLLINGFMMTRIESVLALEPDDQSPQWAKLRRVATSSLALWFTIALAGVALVNLT
ncbi:MAG TPA: DUF6644 family protein [Gemmatimonadaceae bacterium]